MSEIWTYYNANTIQITGDVSDHYWPNQIIKITQTTEKFFVVTAVNVVSGNTRLTVSGGGVYTLASAAITAHAMTTNAAPQGLPNDFAQQGQAYAASPKTTPADNDLLPILDSAANYTRKSLTWSNLKAAINAVYKYRTLQRSIDNGDLAIPTGFAGYIQVPITGTLKAWYLYAKQSGSIKIDVWKDSYANFPPTDADSICNGHEPQISSAQKASDTDLSDWSTVALTKGDVILLNVDSCTTITYVDLVLAFEVS